MIFGIGSSRGMVSRFALGLGVLATVGILAGCDLSRNHLKMDRGNNMEFQDYRDALAPRLPEPTEQAESGMDAGIPSLQPYVANPSENLKPMPLVSVSVNQTVPLRDALYELAEQANYDIELDPRITGSVIFTARDKPFDMVVAKISEIAGLRYKFEDDSLRVELDTPYNKTYKIDYLSYIRKNSGSIRNDVAVVSGEGTNTGSQFQASSESEANFWGELDTNIAQMLGVAESKGVLKTGSDPQITAVEPNPAPVEPVVAEPPAAAEGGTSAEGGASAQPTVQVQPPNAVLQVSSLPADPAAQAATPGGAETEAAKSSFALNKQAGMVSVFATERQHKLVEEYLKDLRRAVTAQVLIEAKVLEVSLADEFAAGIDWGTVALDFLGGQTGIAFDTAGSIGTLGQGTNAANGVAGISPAFDTVATSSVKAFYTGNDISAAVQAVSRYGTVHALASPRLTVLNNQSAVLNVADNRVYFELDIDVTTTDNTIQTNIDSEIKNVPEGVLINVQPSIDLDRGTISMAIRPTITRITDFVEDPSVQFVTAQNNIEGVQSLVPVVNIQEMDSVVNLGSGQAIIMGGLMQDRTQSEQVGVPVLAEVPVLGGLFRTQSDRITKTELVVFIKATIIDGTGSIHDTDRDLYKSFSGDRRPLKM